MGANILKEYSQIVVTLNISINDKGNNIWLIQINDDTYRIYAPNPDSAINRAIVKHYS